MINGHSHLPYSLNYAGAISASYLLEELEAQISKVKEEAFSRKEILEKVQKWLLACEEECWLEEYNRVSHIVVYVSLILFQYINMLPPKDISNGITK